MVPLVLHIHGTRPVVGRSRLRALGGFQVVVAVFRTGIQHIVVRQIEDALQLCHHALLVALQLALTGHHRHREPLAVLVAILLALQQHVVVVLRRIVVIVGVLVPVHVQRDIIPLAAHRCRRIVVAQVVGIDVATGVTAVLRAQDVLLIIRTLGIQLQPLYRLIRQSFGHLPVTVFVHRLVPTVRQHHALGPFLGGILPSVVALQLEVRLAVEFAQGECHRVMLAQVVMCAVARAVVHIETSLVVLLRNDVDDAGHRVATVQRTLRTLHNLYLLDVLRVNQPQVVLTAHIAVDALAVHQYQDIAVAQSVQLHLTAHVALVEGKRRRQACEDFLQTLAAILTQHLLCDDLRLHGRILQQVTRTSTRHYHLLDAVLTPDVRLRHSARRQQPKANSHYLSHRLYSFRTANS